MPKQSKATKMLAKFICYAIQAKWDKTDGRKSMFDKKATELFTTLKALSKDELIAAEKEMNEWHL